MSVAGTLIHAVSQRAPRAVRSAVVTGVLVVPVVVLAFLLTRPEHDHTVQTNVGHFYIVTFVSMLGFAISAGITVGSGRLRDARAFFLNLGFLSVSGIFLVHAVTTPGVLVQMNPTVGLAARLSLFVGSIAFVMSTLRWRASVNDWIGTRWRSILMSFGVCWLLFAAISLRAPDVIMETVERLGGHGLYSATSGETPVMALAALGMFAAAAWRFFVEYRLSVLPAQATLAAGMVFLGEAQLAMWLSPVWAFSWWGYHLLMLAGFLTTVVGFGLSYTRRRSLSGLFETLFLTDTIDRIEVSYTEAIVALVSAVEARDRYTQGHSARVSQIAVLVGEAMRLPGASLRSLGRAGLIHDVGKLAVPDAILSKPGRLTTEEYEVVKEHPMRGFEVIGRIASLREELPGVLHHHEWYDGTGYPHGLAGEEIPLAARILAVADVYDALISDRPYRGALSPDEALAHLQRMAGSQFDRAVVEAFARVEPAWRQRQTKLQDKRYAISRPA
jgi:hypothetical protein